MRIAFSGERGWRNLLLALTSLTIILYLVQAFLVPGSAEYAPFTIADDARQFLAWAPELRDSGYRQDELLARYWHSVSPPLYRWIYTALAAAGVAPVVAARIIPAVLLACSAWLAWRLASKMTRHPAAAFVAAALIMALLIRDNSIYSATPRAFAPPLLLLFFDALLRGKTVAVVLSLGGLAAMYPSSALVGLTMFGLSKVRLRPRPSIDLSPRSITLVAVATLAVAAPLYAFRAQADEWQPLLTVAQALEMPNLGTADGRNAIVGRNDVPAWLCSQRMGFLPTPIRCSKGAWAAAVNLVMLLPLLLLAATAAVPRLRRHGLHADDPDNRIYLWALAACLLWWAVATAVAFQLHLPGRYSQRVLSILAALAAGQLLGGALVGLDWTAARRTAGAAVGAIIALIVFSSPKPDLHRPSDPRAILLLAYAPPGTRVAGLSADLDFVPALTRTSVLATVEHAIPYHRGYFDRIAQRLNATLGAAAEPDATRFAEFVRHYEVDLFIADRALIERGQVPPEYETVVPSAVRQAQRALQRQPSHLQQRARSCAVHRGEVWILTAECLVSDPSRAL
jgi:hypothetical protein